MKVIFAGKVPKDFDFCESNEDAFAIKLDGLRLAMSDGASESYDSKSWSHLLVNKFVENPILDGSWLEDLIDAYTAMHDFPNLSWSKQASFARGSFATLIGVQCLPEQQSISVLCIGDSIAVFLDQFHCIDSFAHTCASDFMQRPELLCTAITHNYFVNSPDFITTHFKTWSFHGYKFPKILCMTDALGEWALRNAEEGNPQWEFLCSITTEDQLADLVTSQRANKLMRVDDSTLIHVDLVGIEACDLPNA